MACGRAVYVYDTFGGDGWVTPDVYAAMEADHFAGQATDRVIGIEEMERDLADYDPPWERSIETSSSSTTTPAIHVIELIRRPCRTAEAAAAAAAG